MERYDKKAVNVLGTEYTIFIRDYNQDVLLKENDWEGYCSNTNKIVVLANPKTLPGAHMTDYPTLFESMKRTLRHELTHAFLNESGLQSNTYATPSAWTENEEMVDWFAIQSPKMFKLFNELEIL